MRAGISTLLSFTLLSVTFLLSGYSHSAFAGVSAGDSERVYAGVRTDDFAERYRIDHEYDEDDDYYEERHGDDEHGGGDYENAYEYRCEWYGGYTYCYYDYGDDHGYRDDDYEDRDDD